MLGTWWQQSLPGDYDVTSKVPGDYDYLVTTPTLGDQDSTWLRG